MAIERRLLWRIAAFMALFTLVSAADEFLGPHIIREPQNTTFNVDSSQQSTYLDCEAQGTPKPKYYWQKDSQNLTFTDDVFLSGGRLTINDPNRNTHAGWYQCFASNDVGTVMSQPAYLAFAYVNSFPFEARTDYEMTEDEGGCIDCEIPDFAPGVTVQWFYKSAPIISSSATRTTFDGRLCFASIMGNNEGLYNCAVTNIVQSGTQKLSKQFYVQVNGNSRPDTSSPPTRAVDVEDRTVLLGESVSLECYFFGNSVPNLRWSRTGGTIPSKAQTNKNNQELIIPDVELDDAGEYECSASNDIQDDVKISGRITVKVPPQWLTELEDVSADIYDEATLECAAESPDGVTYEWYRNTELLTSRDRHTFSNNQQTLKITDLDRTDTAIYQCVAKNDFGAAYSTGQLTVRAIAPTFHIPLPTNQPAPRDGSVIIKCQPDAAPKPTIEWYHGEEKLNTGGRYTIMEDGNLQITDVNDDDGGSYKCVATNTEGTAESVGSLAIKDGTSIQEHPEEKVITVGTDYTLRCSATTDEVFELAYFWMKGETQIDVVDDPHYEMDEGNLIIKDVQLTHAGLYTCVAQTTVDRAETSAMINVKGPPGPPAGVSVEITSTSNDVNALVSWMPGADHYSEIIYYKIESRTEYMPEWKEERDTIPATVQEVRLNGVSPWSTYEFRVTAMNDLGYGQPSEPSEPVTTPQKSPTKAPENVRGCCGGVGNLKIEWDALHMEDWNAPELLYIVAWQRADSDSDDFDEYTTIGEGTTHHLVTGVPAYTMYSVKVRATNTEGMGPFSPPAEVYSFQELPEAVPTNVKGSSKSGSSIRVSWTGIDANSFQGVLGGYKVKYWPSSDTIDVAQVHRSEGSATATDITGLSFGTDYKFVVVAYNGDNENGPDSSEGSAGTLKSPPLAVPGGLKVSPDGKNGLSVSWKAIKVGSTEEPLQGYKVLYWKEGQFEKDAEVKTINNPSTVKAVLSGLTNKETYLVKVRGYSKGGDGPVQDTPAKLNLESVQQGASRDGSGGGGASTLSVSFAFLFALSLLSLLYQPL
ncbi:contactin-4-like [Amphiura filiformis]|uniref:contactin-4-like n=1 Tax=Amphiura filiformis TaxID=82378 RepID=UPI003B213C58